MKKKVLYYAIAIGAGLAVTFAIACLIGLFKSEDTAAVFRKLADASTVTGILTFGIGLLTFCGNHGAFDMIGWGVKNGLKMLIPMASLKANKKTYAEYKEERAANPKPFKFLLLTGAVFLVLAIVFIGLFYGFYVPPAT